MVTLKTLLAYEKLHEIVEEFLREKVTEYNNAEEEEPPYSEYGSPGPVFRGFEIEDREKFVKGSLVNEGKDIRISFGWDCDLEINVYTLPLETIFDDDFYEQMKAVFDTKRKKLVEKKRNEEKELYEKLKRKYEGDKTQ